MGILYSRFKGLKSNPIQDNPFTDINNFQFQENDNSRGPYKPNMYSCLLREENRFAEYENVLDVKCSQNTTCVFGTDDYSVQLFDFSKNKKIKIWKGHENDITKVIYCSQIDRYISASRDKSIKMWQNSSENSELNMLGHELVVTSIASDPQNNFLISGSRDNNMNLWDLKVGSLLSTANISRNLITDVSWSNDGKTLIQSSEDKELRLWDPLNLKVIFDFPKKQYIQYSCHISNDNFYAISTSNGFQSQGCEITVWDLRGRRILSELIGHEQTVTSAKIINNDKFIISCSNDGTVRLWDLKKLEFIESIYLAGSLTSVSASDNSKNRPC